MEQRTAIVVGSGIAGPVVAIALRHAGIAATVYEAHPPSEGIGTFLNVASNGLAVLRMLGIHEQVREAGFATPSMTMWSDRGKKLGEVPNGTTLDDGTTSVTMQRSELHRVLAAAARDHGIEVQHEKRLVSAETTERGVIARFADGTSATADFLVGADGIHSVTRGLLDPQAPRAAYTGLVSVGGIARLDTIDETPGAYHMIFGRHAFFGYSVPRRGEVYWFSNLAVAEPSREALRAFGATDWKERLLALHGGDAGPAGEIIAATTAVSAYPIHDLARVPVWHRGRMVLVGDAAHATSPSAGQGASLAIEDALVLARSLRDARDIESAFATYEAARRARVERVVRESRRISNQKAPGPVGRFFRDLFMPIVLRRFAGEGPQAWLHQQAIEW